MENSPGHSLELIEPINARIRVIRESLLNRQVLTVENERMLYGNLENALRNYRKEEGIDKTETDFYNYVMKEISIIWNSTIEVQRKLRQDGKEAQFHSVFNGLSECKQIIEEKIKDFEQSENHIIRLRNNVSVENTQSTVETEKLSEIFLPYAIKAFIEIERRLLNTGFIDEKYCLKGQKSKLVALIHFLSIRGYFKTKRNKNSSVQFKVYRKFFENRYKTNIANMAQPSKFPKLKLIEFEPEFYFIENIKTL